MSCSVTPPSRLIRLIAMFPIVFASAPLGRTLRRGVPISLVLPKSCIAFPRVLCRCLSLVILCLIVVARRRIVLSSVVVLPNRGKLTRGSPALRETTLKLRCRVTLARVLPLCLTYVVYLARPSLILINFRRPNVRPTDISAESFSDRLAVIGTKLIRRRGAVLLTRSITPNICRRGPCLVKDLVKLPRVVVVCLLLGALYL